MKNYILLGPPAAGKGTFSGQIKKFFPNIAHISSGDIFRENLKNNTSLGQKVKQYIDKGALVPDEITNDVMMDRLKMDDVQKNGCILDGYPRTLKQAEYLSQGFKIDRVLLFNVDKELLKKRILGRYSCSKCNAIYNKFLLPPKKEGICDKCGAAIKFEQRSDDNAETFKKRLEVYESTADQLIAYYKKQKILKEIKTENTLELPDKEIKKLLGI